MPSGNRKIILQPRDRKLLKLLSDRRVMSRDQIAALAGFGSITRVNVRLSKLRTAGLVTRYYTASSTGSYSSIYALTRKGAQEAETSFQALKWNPDAVVIGNAFAAHQLAVTDVCIAALSVRHPHTRWKTLTEPIAARLVPDALIEGHTNESEVPLPMFLEVDLGTETRPTWTRKIENYLQLASSGEFKQIVPARQFAVLVVTTSAARLQLLRKHAARYTNKLFWFTTLLIIKQTGFWSPVWARPSGDQLVPPGA